MIDKWPDKPRIVAVRDSAGLLIGFDIVVQWNGIHTLSRHATMQAALAHTTDLANTFYGPMRSYPNSY